MVSYEYRVFETSEPLSQQYLENEFGIDGFMLAAILQYENMFYYNFQRCNKLK